MVILRHSIRTAPGGGWRAGALGAIGALLAIWWRSPRSSR